MKLAGFMFFGAALSALLVTSLTGFKGSVDIWLGMLAPAAVASLEWSATERTIERAPGLVTSLMLRIFIGKVVVFAGYVTVVLAVTGVHAERFVVSFVSYFLALFIIEAFALHRLMSRRLLRG